MSWDNVLKAKNAMYRVEEAVCDGQLFDCQANPHKLTCHCRKFCHENFCKHVCACNHVKEMEKPREERNHLLNLNRWTAPLPRDKSREANALGQKRGGGGGYRMNTNCYVKGSKGKRRASPAPQRGGAKYRKQNARGDSLDETRRAGRGDGPPALSAAEIQEIKEAAIAQHEAQEKADAKVRQKAAEEEAKRARAKERERKAEAVQKRKAAAQAAQKDKRKMSPAPPTLLCRSPRHHHPRPRHPLLHHQRRY